MFGEGGAEMTAGGTENARLLVRSVHCIGQGSFLSVLRIRIIFIRIRIHMEDADSIPDPGG